ncbi:MAG: hypothetical protein R3245_04050 [Kiloniellales bacterium]|nr:hypothetical protein [Kiloniellales bacterium]
MHRWLRPAIVGILLALVLPGFMYFAFDQQFRRMDRAPQPLYGSSPSQPYIVRQPSESELSAWRGRWIGSLGVLTLFYASAAGFLANRLALQRPWGAGTSRLSRRTYFAVAAATLIVPATMIVANSEYREWEALIWSLNEQPELLDRLGTYPDVPEFYRNRHLIAAMFMSAAAMLVIRALQDSIRWYQGLLAWLGGYIAALLALAFAFPGWPFKLAFGSFSIAVSGLAIWGSLRGAGPARIFARKNGHSKQ